MSFVEDFRLTETSYSPQPRPADETERGSVEESAEPRFLAVGRVSKPHGLNGEVRVELLTDVPERFEWLKSIYVGETKPRLIDIDSVRFHQGGVLLKLAGYPTRTEAELLRGELLQVPESEAVPLEEGEYFLYQLVGLDVFTEKGTNIGRLSEVMETGANNVFVINGPSGQHLVPYIPDVIKEIDLEAGRLVIHPMPGLINNLEE